MAKKENLIHEPNTTQIHNVILDHWVGILNDLEYKVLTVICRKTFGWHKKRDRISISQICEIVKKTENPVRQAVHRLIEFKLVNRTFNKNKGGNHSPNSYEINVLQLNKKEKIDRGVPLPAQVPYPCQQEGVPLPAGDTKPTTSKPTLTKGNACGEPIVHNSPSEVLKGSEVLEDLPFHKENLKEEAKPKSKSSRKYARPAHEEEVFQWLKTLNLNTNENTLSYWAHTYQRKTLVNTWGHLKHKMSKGYRPQNMGGLFKTLLETENCPVTDECLSNKTLAENFKRHTGWNSLELRERFCCDDDRPDYDLPYMIPERDFKERLVRMWELKTGKQYRGQNETIAIMEESYSEELEESYD